MFKFNFDAGNQVPSDVKSDETQTNDDCHSCREVTISEACGNGVFKPLTIGEVTFFIADMDCTNVEEQNFTLLYKKCDVIPKIYEGGLKVWECTFDLLLFLMRNEVSFAGKIVLDLGCGSGLLGIFAGMKGAEVVHFQDYNAEVLKNFTIPNVLNSGIPSKTKFVAGDWNGFGVVAENTAYDFILSSEILYNAENYDKLRRLFASKLRKNAEILIASKSYYFGVGGSVQQFQECLNRRNELKWKTVWKNTEGVQREILSIKLAVD